MKLLKKIVLFSFLLVQNLNCSSYWGDFFGPNGEFFLSRNINFLWFNNDGKHLGGSYKNTLNDLVGYIADSCPHLSTDTIEKVLLRNYLSLLNSFYVEDFRNTLKEKQLALASSLRINEINVSASFQKEQLTMKLQGIKDIFKMSGEGLFSLLGDKERMAYLSLGIIGIVGGYFVIKRGTKIVADIVEKNLNTPKLLTETSWKNPVYGLIGHIVSLKNLFFSNKRDSIHDHIIIAPEIDQHIKILTKSTEQAHAYNDYYQNVLLYGLPGTGKTFFATLLAHKAGMDYGIMSGTNFDQYDEEESLVQLNKLFDWAESCNKGVILFIDEAETFLGKRSDMNAKQKRLLNAFLHRTGAQSKKFMLVCATNRPDMLDKAVLSRLAVKIEFPLPGFNERLKMIKLYLKNDYHADQYKNIDINVIAHATDGFSGRQIAQMVTAFKAEMLGLELKILTQELVDNVVRKFIVYHMSSDDLKAFA